MTNRAAGPVRCLVAGSVLLLVSVVAGCSSSDDADSTAASRSTTSTASSSPSTAADPGSMDMGSSGADSAGVVTDDTGAAPKVECAQHMPGDLLSAQDAIVFFDSQHVCLAYVTVLAGTTITWRNTDGEDHEVVVVDDEEQEFDRFTVPGGGVATSTAPATGVYRYRLTAIESFVGTIEVQ